jgi:hypothetical protein
MTVSTTHHSLYFAEVYGTVCLPLKTMRNGSLNYKLDKAKMFRRNQLIPVVEICKILHSLDKIYNAFAYSDYSLCLRKY